MICQGFKNSRLSFGSRSDSGNSIRCCVALCYFILALSMLLQTGCDTSHPKHKQSTMGTAETNPAPQVSHLRLPITVDCSVLTKAADKQLPKKIDINLDRTEYGVRVNNVRCRRKTIEVRGLDDGIDIASRVSATCKCTFLGVPFTIDLDIIAGLKPQPSMDTNWVLQLNAQPFCEVEDIHIQGIPVAFLSWLRERIAREIVDSFLEPHIADIEEQVADSNFIRKSAEQILGEICSGFQVNDSPALWLQLEPIALHIPELRVDGNSLVCCVGMDALVRASLVKPTPKAQPVLSLSVSTPAADGLLINGHVIGSLNDWEAMLRPNVPGMEVEVQDGTTVNIKDFRLTGCGTAIAVQLQFQTRGKWRVKGEMVLVGTPTYDIDRREVYLQNLDYDLHTRHVLAKVASWLLHEGVRRRVQEVVRYNISTEMNNFKSLMNHEFENYPVVEGTVLEARVTELDVQAIHTKDRSLIVPFILKGSGKLVIKKIEIP